MHRRAWRGLLTITSVISIVAAWYVGAFYITTYKGLDESLLPTPGQVLRRTVEELQSGSLLSELIVSGQRVAVGVFLGITIAFATATVVSLSWQARYLLSPLIWPLRYMPIPALIPLTMLFFGISDGQKVVIIGWAAFFVAFPTAMYAFGGIARRSIEVGLATGLKGRRLLVGVALPAMAPQAYNAGREALAFGWSCVILAEMVAGGKGIGLGMMQAQRWQQEDSLWVRVFAILIVGYALDAGLSRLRPVLLPWTVDSKSASEQKLEVGLQLYPSTSLATGNVTTTPAVAAVLSRVQYSVRTVGGDDKNIVDNFSLVIRRGEIVSLLGPSGAGKTSVIRILAGLAPPSSGTCAVASRMSVVFQGGNCLPWLDVTGNILFGRGVREERIPRIVKDFDLEGLERRYPSSLSGGEAQRVALARTILSESHLWLLDEPLSAVDSALRRRLRKLLRETARTKGAGALWVTHDVEEAVAVSDRIILVGASPMHNVGEIIVSDDMRLNPHATSREVEQRVLDAMAQNGGASW